jgi:hypothetical protein
MSLPIHPYLKVLFVFVVLFYGKKERKKENTAKATEHVLHFNKGWATSHFWGLKSRNVVK